MDLGINYNNKIGRNFLRTRHRYRSLNAAYHTSLRSGKWINNPGELKSNFFVIRLLKMSHTNKRGFIFKY